MKYRTQTAEVLNAADDFERMLDWYLFHSEQLQRLFGFDPKVEWTPGDPIYQNPRTVDRDCTCGIVFCGCEPDNEELEGYYGNAVRPMIEEFVDADFYRKMRCEDCDVSWGRGGETTCWMCGEVRDPVGIVSIKEGFLSQPVWETTIDVGPDGMMATMRLQAEIYAGLRLEIGESWQRVMNETMESLRNFSVSFQTASDNVARAFGGIRSHFTIHDEANRYILNDWVLPEPYVYVPAPRPRNPFEVEEREIELVPPVAANLMEEVRGRVELPADVDLSGRVEPPMPQMPELDRFPGVGETRNTFNPPITERRPR